MRTESGKGEFKETVLEKQDASDEANRSHKSICWFTGLSTVSGRALVNEAKSGFDGVAR